jgi:putative acetyltransferase
VIRSYRSTDVEATRRVFVNAIRGTASGDYGPEQIDVWAASAESPGWGTRRESVSTWIAVDDDAVVGFADVDEAGHVGMMFVDPSVGRRGVGAALLEQVRAIAGERGQNRLSVDASITARPFFERHGFSVIREQRVHRNGLDFVNYRMEGGVE